MMRWVIGSSLKYRFLVIAFAAMMIFVGFGQIREMPVDVFPEFAPPRIEIQTGAPGLAPAEVESLITVPMEESLAGLPDLDVMRSNSVEQLSSIQLILKPDTDLLRARQLVEERLSGVTPTLPSWASSPFVLQPLSATSRVMKIGVTSKEIPITDLSLISYWTMRARLLRVPGVANVAIWGERPKMMQVLADPERMKARGVSLDQVMKVTADALDAGLLRYSSGAHVGTGGFLETAQQRLPVQHKLPIVASADLGKLPVVDQNGKTLRLDEVATVEEGSNLLIGDAVINDGDGLMLIVEKLPWGNTLDVTRGVEEALAELRPGLPGVEVDSTIFRPASFVETAIDNLTDSLLLGALLVVLVLALFLFEWRSALISVITIPLSLVAALLVLAWRGSTLNTMILAGLVIAIGAVVDDAIVDVENIVRRLRLERAAGSGRSTSAVILAASLEVRGAVVYASLIEAAALFPIFFLEGLTGAFFRPLAFSYALAVLVSLVIALVVTPALSLILFRRANLDRRGSPLVGWMQRGYGAALSRIVRRPTGAMAVLGATLVAGFAVLPQLGQSLLPDFKERDFLMHWVAAPGTSLPESKRITTQASKELREVPGVRNFGAHIGQALLADEVVGVNFGENWISIDPSADYDATLAKVNEVVEGYPGLRRDVQTYLKERIREVLTGSGDAIVVQIYGNDLEVLRQKGNEIKELLGSTDGIIEEHVQLQVEVPEIQVKPDLAAVQKVGLRPGDVRRAAATLMAGEEVGDVFRENKTYDVVVWSTPQTRTSVSSVRDLLIDTPAGGRVRLGDIAAVEVAPTPNGISHENLARSIEVGANVKGRDLGSVAGEVEEKLKGVEFPLEYRYELLGEYTEAQEAQRRLLLFAGAALVVILLLLRASLRSWRLAVLSLFTLPIALIGGVIAAYGAGGVISLGSLVGFFTVLGIVARNGIMLISHFQHLEHEEGEPFGPALVVRGAKERLAPIMMTALTTGLALVPLVMFGELAGQEIEHPMAIVILGGLLASTILNLFIVPTLYLRFGKSKKERSRLNAEAAPA
ncbi:MAG: Cobalt-zinc-cadmium resistance protein CzcA; Cation efflux system protein CusA [uncultured Acidimicrobiales bacterium]|uniref:Cobalt-zinc-cadmium resistance protein CzcA Cation efflux system protein CusA n=1 Tax=uncultured Acidimicrobiales bacterium TaxID=310071 RepID=A0A6J4HX69_9ACTN|nr:MAG: Cobalt-zinc-cadmium resistance protein CzcA; Cation efflux system protein CusA [uncultured Acidimicrobiales bacterium]